MPAAAKSDRRLVSGLRAAFLYASLRMTCRFPWRILQAAVPGHESSARGDITLKIVTVWLPGPHAAESPVP